MADVAQLAAATLLPLFVVLLATPLAIRVACRMQFYDHPVGYKGHPAPTPYLGGAAVIGAFLVGAVVAAAANPRLVPILVFTLVLWVVGTVDDRRTLRPSIRVLIASAAATTLWLAGLGWSVFDGEVANLLLTNLWVIGLVNAFNLMDNMDGAAGSVTAVAAFGASLVAITDGAIALGALFLALAAACAGFLRYNLASPARIFLGDGGSMPIGFIMAAGIMALPNADVVGLPALAVGALLVALPILDTTLVVVSRTRRGLSVMTGGRDHLTHRMRARLGSPRMVAVALAVAQGAFCSAALLAAELAATPKLTVVLLAAMVAALALVVLERPGWAPSQEEPSASG